MSQDLQSLPIYRAEAAFFEAYGRGPVVLSAPTGSGKSTVVPRWCARGGQRVLVVEPRRVACRSLARFVAAQLGVELGQEVGYAVRHDERIGAQTRVAFVTPGVALRMLGTGGRRAWDTFVVDELHERSLEVDLVLALLAEDAGPGLVVMSATLDGDRVAAFLGGTHLRAEGRAFPVDVAWHSTPLLPSPDELDRRVAKAVDQALEHTGDVLVFLPGKAEIAACAAVLRRRTDVEVLALHGALPPEEQDRAFGAAGQRRVILATNVAETSVTLPRIGVVVDSGLVRQRRPRGGRSHLTLVPIAMDAAEQRRGRAGRLFPGHCIRLWSPAAVLDEVTRPAMLREPLSAVVLAAAACGRRVGQLALLDPPPRDAVDRAERALQAMEALDDQGLMTPLGARLFRLPLDPHLGRILLVAERGPALQDALDLVAALGTGRSLFLPGPRPEDPEDDLRADGCDATALVRALREGQAGRHGLHPGALHEARQGAAQLRRMLKVGPATGGRVDRPALVAAILVAHPAAAFVSRQRGRQLAWANGRGRELSLGRESCVPEDAPALVVVDTRALTVKRRAVEVITCALPAGRADLRAAGLGSVKVEQARIEAGRIVAVTVRSHAGLVLAREEEVAQGQAARDALETLLLRGSLFAAAVRATRDRLEARRLLARLRPDEPGAPELAAWIRARIETLGVESGDDLCLLEANDFLCADLEPEALAWLDRHFPRTLSLGDARYEVTYETAKRAVTIAKVGGTRRAAPDLRFLPGWPGWKVLFREGTGLRVLREK